MNVDLHKLDVALEECGIAETKLCEAAGISHCTLRKIKAGKRVRTGVIKRLCIALQKHGVKVTPGKLGRDDDETVQAAGSEELLH